MLADGYKLMALEISLRTTTRTNSGYHADNNTDRSCLLMVLPLPGQLGTVNLDCLTGRQVLFLIDANHSPPNEPISRTL